MRRYFISYASNLGDSLQCSSREISVDGDLNLENIAKKIEKLENRSNVVVLFFKELKNHEYCFSVPQADGKTNE